MPTNDSSVKVSVIVPCYNIEQYIDACVDSILRQSFRDLEVICVDDGSTDSTLAHIRHLAERDERIKIVCHNSNQYRLQTRKDGVAVACGDYIMFVDGDDFIEPTLVERAYKSIEGANTDIVQYRVCVENCANLPELRIEYAARPFNTVPLQVFKGDVLGTGSSVYGLLEQCFLKGVFGFNITNKMFRADTCKLAFAEVPDGSFNMAEDILAMFHLLRRAKTYTAIDFVGYHYCFGRGLTGRNTMTRDRFELHCELVRVYKAIRRWIYAHADSQDEVLFEVLANIRGRLLNDVVVKAIDNMATEDVHWALSRINEVWQLEQEELLTLIAKARFFDCKKVAPILQHVDDMAYKPRPIRTVALYYHNIQNGGAQRVVCMVANRLAQQESGGHYRYRVILITDDGPTDNEYGLDERIERYYVPDYTQCEKEMYGRRAKAWREVLDKTRPDVLIDSLWESPVSFWDMLVIKSHSSHPAVLFHCHNFFGLLFGLRGKGFSNIRSMLSLADGLVTLSKADEVFWSSYCPRVWTIPNPSAFETSVRDRTSGDMPEVLWVGRIAPEKQVGDIVRAMSIVHQVIPDATCRIVGEGDEQSTSSVRALVEQFGLQDTVLFEGFSASVEDYYRKAAVFCLTSKYEGFTLTLYEAAAFGVPTVMYELPWLEYNRIIKGGISVPQRDHRALANAIVNLFLNREEWQRRSDQLFESSVAYQHMDIDACWNGVLAQLEGNMDTGIVAGDESKLLSLVTDFHLECIEQYVEELSLMRIKLQRAHQEKSEINAKLQRAYQEKSEINAKLQRAYKEKSEINAKLQITYREKAERGVMIKELQEQLANAKKKAKAQAKEIDALKARINDLSKTLVNRAVGVGKRVFKRK